MKTGRNAPCPCGSGKKYKKCCLQKKQQTARKPSSKSDFNQSPPRESDQKVRCQDTGINIRPDVIAKMCDPAEQHVQDLFARQPELRRNNMISYSEMRSLSKEQIIKQLSERGISYNEDQFIAMCEKNTSAWDVAEMLWPKQAKSLSHDIADIVCLDACVLWERLYDEKKLTKVSIELLDNWMQDGYKELDQDHLKACRTWLKVWETFKKDYDLTNSSISEIDDQFNGMQSFYNWCQDFEMELVNASIDSKEYAKIGVAFFNEFLTYFADDDEIYLVNALKSSLGECYCRAGEQETGEKIMRELIRHHPDKAIGYIGMETALAIREKNGLTPTHEERLKILEQARNYPVSDGKDFDLDRRISYLKEEIRQLNDSR